MTIRLFAEPLEQRQLLFAHALVDDPKSTQLFVSVTDSYVYYESQPAGLGTGEGGDGRTFARVAIKTGKVQTIDPASDDGWDLAALTSTRAFDGDAVLMTFNDGTVWSVVDGAKKATKIADVRAATLGRSLLFDDAIYFLGNAGRGVEWYRSDGTAKGTAAIPGFVKDSSDDLPDTVAIGAGHFFFSGVSSTDSAPRLYECDGTSIGLVSAMAKHQVSDFAFASGHVVAISERKLYLVSGDLRSAATFATSRAPRPYQVATVGKGVAFLDDNGVYYSDLTTRGTKRIGDEPALSYDDFDTSIRFDPSGYLIDAYTGYSEVHNSSDDTTVPPSIGPAVYRVTPTGLAKVIDGSYDATRHLDGSTYFFDDDTQIPGGLATRISADGSVTTLRLRDDALFAASGRNAIAFADAFEGTLYVIDPTDTTGAIVGNVVSDLNLNGKANGSDKPVTSGTAFVDYNHNGKLDRGEPSALIGDGLNGVSTPGQYTLTGVRAGKTTVVLQPGSNYRGPTIAQRTNVHASDVATMQVLATPLFSTIRVDVFADADGDGVRDAGEAGVSGVSAYLDFDNDGNDDADEPMRTSSGDGIATFARLTPGLFRVRILHPSGDVLLTTATYAKLRVAPDGTAVVQVGVQRDPHTSRITGSLNDANSSAFSGAKVQLLQGATVVQTVVAGDDGGFAFAGLPGGDYDVQVIEAGRFHPGQSIIPIHVDATRTADVEVPVKIDPVASGVAYFDANGNGFPDDGEPPLANVRVVASRGGTLPTVSTTTDSTGHFTLVLPLGKFSDWTGELLASDATFGSAYSTTIYDGGEQNGIYVRFAHE